MSKTTHTAEPIEKTDVVTNEQANEKTSDLHIEVKALRSAVRTSLHAGTHCIGSKIRF
jgi:hypothetical protein